MALKKLMKRLTSQINAQSQTKGIQKQRQNKDNLENKT